MRRTCRRLKSSSTLCVIRQHEQSFPGEQASHQEKKNKKIKRLAVWLWSTGLEAVGQAGSGPGNSRGVSGADGYLQTPGSVISC